MFLPSRFEKTLDSAEHNGKEGATSVKPGYLPKVPRGNQQIISQEGPKKLRQSKGDKRIGLLSLVKSKRRRAAGSDECYNCADTSYSVVLGGLLIVPMSEVSSMSIGDAQQANSKAGDKAAATGYVAPTFSRKFRMDVYSNVLVFVHKMLLKNGAIVEVQHEGWSVWGVFFFFFFFFQ